MNCSEVLLVADIRCWFEEIIVIVKSGLPSN